MITGCFVDTFQQSMRSSPGSVKTTGFFVRNRLACRREGEESITLIRFLPLLSKARKERCGEWRSWTLADDSDRSKHGESAAGTRRGFFKPLQKSPVIRINCEAKGRSSQYYLPFAYRCIKRKLRLAVSITDKG